jgi:hypothetical protein
MTSDFWKPINLAEFNERTGHAYQPVTGTDIALEHWIERSGVLLASSSSIALITTTASPFSAPTSMASSGRS